MGDSMAAKHWIDDTHYRVTDEDGKTSYIYQVKGLFGRSVLVGFVEHNPDGSNVAYKAAGDVDAMFKGRRGQKCAMRELLNAA